MLLLVHRHLHLRSHQPNHLATPVDNQRCNRRVNLQVLHRVHPLALRAPLVLRQLHQRVPQVLLHVYHPRNHRRILLLNLRVVRQVIPPLRSRLVAHLVSQVVHLQVNHQALLLLNHRLHNRQYRFDLRHRHPFRWLQRL